MLAALVMMQPSLAEEFERIRTEHKLPSICAGAIVDGKVVALEAVGFRRLGSPERVTVEDRYHLGSNTKAFTATLAALLVQRGKLAWDAPLTKLLPNAEDSAYRDVTPRLLAQHRAGMTGKTDLKGLDEDGSQTPVSVQRADYVSRMLALPPSSPPGTRFEYSNAGYVALGVVLERATGRSWEELMRREIFKPLGLSSAGFGAADAGGKAAPVGHLEFAGKLIPVRGLDNPPALGPAGTLHMTVRDALKWCAFQADEGRHRGILKPDGFAVLHTPPQGEKYVGGFVVESRSWAGGPALYHQGSNTANLQAMWIAPRKRFALVAATNAANEAAQDALDEISKILILRFCPQEGRSRVGYGIFPAS